MCGILGHFSNDKINLQTAKAMQERIAHRGPDDSGLYAEDNMFIAHNRLSILDLTSAGHQPMWNAEKSIGIVFNGEIYNFKEIRQELSEFKFYSQTDTEVIIYAYQKWGIKKAIEKFNGMFSFCIYDKRKNKCFFVRDRVGIKPFVYFWNGHDFIFASELKAIVESTIVKREINPKAVYNFFIYRYIGHPNTIFKNIFKLTPGHYLELDLKNFNLREYTYWELPNQRYLSKPENQLLDEIEYLIQDAVRLRLIADTEVASFLSGGIDSSLISGFAKKLNPALKAFTIDLQPPQHSEAEYARLMAKNNSIKLEQRKVGQQEYKQNFDSVFSFYDEPFADSSFVPTWLLCKFVHDSNIKCALSGDGGDELFYGYNWYHFYQKLDKFGFFRHIFPKKIIQLLKHHSILKPLSYLIYNSLERYRRVMYDRYTVSEINTLFAFSSDFHETDFYEKRLAKNKISPSEFNWLDFHTFLVDDILYKVDIASMANSLEVRVPFLDHRLVELLFAIQFKRLYQNAELKYLLKKIALRHIPKQNIYRPKKGFSAPVMKWIGKDFNVDLQNGKLIKSGIVNKSYMNKIINAEINPGKIWQLYVFEKWFANYVS